MPGVESPFSQQCARFLDNLGISSTCSSLLAVELTMVYRHGFQCTSSQWLRFKRRVQMKKKIRSVDKRCHLRSANSASITSQSHWPSSGEVWVRACNVWLPQGPQLQLQHEHGGAYWQTKALQTSWLSPNSHLFPNCATTAKWRPAVLSTVRKVWMVISTGAGSRKLFERFVRRRRDMQTLIPYRTRGTVARPASGNSCRPTSL